MDDSDFRTGRADDAQGQIIHLTASPSKTTHPDGRIPSQVSFDRRELSEILRVYGYRVAEGEWRDYAMDFQKDRAVFSIFRRSSEMPVYRIEKIPKNTRKQGAYCVVNAAGMILKRGHELRQVLKILEQRRHLRVVD